MWNVQEQEERDFVVASIAEVDAYEANAAGSRHPDRAWILSDRDVWYANPYYVGPAQRHPEDYGFEDGDDDPAPADWKAPAFEANPSIIDDDIPF